MMKLLFRSHLLQLLPAFVLATLILSFILSMNTVYRLINLIIERGVSVGIVLLMLMYRVPQFLSVTVPLAVVISAVVLISRLSTDFELTAMHAAGINSWKIGAPIILFGMAATAFSLLITLWLQPTGYSAFEEEKLRLLKSQTAKTIQAQILNYDFADKVLYVQERMEDDRLQGVFITDRELNADSMVTVSDEGRIEIREKEQDLVLHLEQGQIHMDDSAGSYRIIDFNWLRYVFKPPEIVSNEKGGHIWAVPTRKLWNDADTESRLELFLRLTTPWACFAFALSMVSLAMVEPRRGRTGAYLRALILVAIYYLLWLGSKELAVSMKFDSHVLWTPPSAIALYGLYNLFKRDLHLQNAREVLIYGFSARFRKSVRGKPLTVNSR